MRHIPITDIAGIMIGHAQDKKAATGATVIMRPEGMAAGVDVRGGGPASRDSRILDPLAAADRIHAVLIAGGSAFGLDAAAGVQRYLEERGYGLDVGSVKVPLVCQSDIFDLHLGDPAIRPDAAMGYAACLGAEKGNYRDGNFGAGCGATVGKALGPSRCMKTGIGSYAVETNGLVVGAIAVVNALGDVVDPSSGETIAGLLDSEGRIAGESEQALIRAGLSALQAGNTSALPPNTTICATITNAALPKAQLCKVASMGHDGMARAIRPVHTSMDGDTVYALSVGDFHASADVVGILAAHTIQKAIISAARSAESAYGLPSSRSIRP